MDRLTTERLRAVRELLFIGARKGRASGMFPRCPRALQFIAQREAEANGRAAHVD